MTDKTRYYITGVFIFLIISLSGSGLAFSAEVYWTDLNGSRITALDMQAGESGSIRLKADIPEGKTLNMYQFTLKYKAGVIELDSVAAAADSAMPPKAINWSGTPGTIIANSFDITGVSSGPISFIDINFTAKTVGEFPFSITVDDFGDTTNFDPAPTPVNLSVTVNAPAAEIYWTDMSGNRISDISLSGAGEQSTFRLNADIPLGRKLKAYQMSLTYNNAYISVQNAVSTPGSIFPVMNTNPATYPDDSGQIIFNSFNTTGIIGPATISFLDMTVQAKDAAGKFPMGVQVNTFIQTPEEAPIPTDISNLEITVGSTSHAITVIAGAGGSIRYLDSTGAEQIVQEAIRMVSVDDGADISFTVAPSAGYVIETVRVNDAAVQLDENSSYLFSGVTAVGKIEAVFRIPAPVAAFEADVTTGDAPLTVKFTDQSTGENLSNREWNFGDGSAILSGNTDAIRNPEHVYSTAGTYTVTLKVTGDGGTGTAEKTDYIVVTEPTVPLPVVAFEADVTEGEAPLTVKFTDQSTGDGLNNWEWDFGDGTAIVSGNADDIRNPQHQYAGSGIYSVTLKVTGNGGTGSLIRSNYITVTQPGVPAPVAGFAADITTGNAPLTVKFTDQSTGEGLSLWEWDFGDGTAKLTGSTDDIRNPQHQYSSAGTYTVSLKVTGSGGTNTAAQTDYIVVNPGIAAPSAGFEADINEGDAPLTVSFSDRSTGEGLSLWEWNFGDGSANLTGSTDEVKNPQHLYSTPGTYSVTLTVTGTGGTDIETKLNYIVVRQSGVAAPDAQFISDKTQGNYPLSVQFTDQSTGEGIYRWEWNFGDGTALLTGTTDAVKNPLHQYTGTGTYSVTLRVFGTGGSDSLIRSNYIYVTQVVVNPPVVDPPVVPTPPTAAFTTDITTGNAPLTVKFTDQSTGDGLYRWEWDFGDGSANLVGSTAEIRSPEHIYTRAGTYTVILKVYGSGGTDALVKKNLVKVVLAPGTAPQADFSFYVQGDDLLTVVFTDTSSPADEIVRRIWNFGDFSASLEAGPTMTHTYSENGVYSVRLQVFNAAGETDNITRLVTVGKGVIQADFTGTPRSGEVPLGVQFRDKSSSSSGITTRLWNFGDGTTASEINPWHEYAAAGSYTVQLTVTGPDGTDTQKVTNYIIVTPTGVAQGVEKPVPVSPPDGSVNIPLETTLQVSAYADADNTYAYTVWEISRDDSFAEASVVWREANTLMTLQVPRFILNDKQTTYWWRVRFVDSAGAASEWSDAFRLTTVQNGAGDTNGNGVPDMQDVSSSEYPAPAAGTLVKYVRTADGSGIFGVEADAVQASAITFLRAFTAAEAGVPDGITLLHGAIGYKISLKEPGTVPQIKIHLPEAAPAGSRWYAWLPGKGWSDYSLYSLFSTDRKTLSLILDDGNFGDIDGIENGEIVVWFSGMTNGIVIETPDDTNTSKDGPGDDGGCFIRTSGL